MMQFRPLMPLAALVAAFFMPTGQPPALAADGWISGPVRGLHPRLLTNLRSLHRATGRHITITPHGGCRLHGNRRAPRSYHRIAAGCRAADIIIPGVSRRWVLRWWARHVGGGRGFYCGRSFVHVDVGPARTWSWYCRRPTRLARRNRRR